MSSEKIRVAIRVKPNPENEPCVLSVDEENNTLYFFENENKLYQFDHVYGEKATSKAIYDACIKDVIKSTLQGTNSTIIAYGSTGSGKTYTMTGNEQSPGVIFYGIADIFDEIKRKQERKYTVSLSFFEIYNEHIKDLLVDTQNNSKTSKLSKQFVNSSLDFSTVYYESIKRRATGSTMENDRSSRSHAIVRITIESKSASGNSSDPSLCSHLDLVDLAGSECQARTQATGQRQMEASNINKSLLALSKIISSVSKNQKSFSYRESKLTEILKDSLGGNARTVIVTTLSNEKVHLAPTKSSIQFAQNAMKITNKPTVNTVKEAKTIAALEKEVMRLKKELEEYKKANNNQMVEKYVKEITQLTGITLGGQNAAHKQLLESHPSLEDQIPLNPYLRSDQKERTQLIEKVDMDLAYDQEIECDQMNEDSISHHNDQEDIAPNDDESSDSPFLLPKKPNTKKKIKLPPSDPNFVPTKKRNTLTPAFLDTSTEETVQKAKEETKFYKEESTRLQTEAMGYKQEVTKTQNELEQIKNENYTLKLKVDELTSRLDHINAEQPEKDALHEQTVKRLHAQINTLTNQLEQKNEHNMILQKEKDTMVIENQSMKQDYERIKSIEGEYGQLLNDYQLLLNEQEETQSEIERLNTLNLNLGYEYKAMELEMSTKSSNYEEEKRRNEKLKEDNEILTDKLRSLQQMIGAADNYQNRIRIKMISDSLTTEITNEIDIPLRENEIKTIPILEEGEKEVKHLQTIVQTEKVELEESSIETFEVINKEESDDDDEEEDSEVKVNMSKIRLIEKEIRLCEVQKRKKYFWLNAFLSFFVILINAFITFYFFFREN